MRENERERKRVRERMRERGGKGYITERVCVTERVR